MILCLLVVTFFAVIVSGPAGVDSVRRRRAERDRPLAKVIYLPLSACHGAIEELPAIDPVLRAVRERDRREWAERHIPRCGCLYFCDISDGEEFEDLVLKLRGPEDAGDIR